MNDLQKEICGLKTQCNASKSDMWSHLEDVIDIFMGYAYLIAIPEFLPVLTIG